MDGLALTALTWLPRLADGGVIPAARAHAPIRWDELMSSLDTVLTALGPDGLDEQGDLGALLHRAATAADSTAAAVGRVPAACRAWSARSAAALGAP